MCLTIREHKSSSYGPRTYQNASEGDVTIALAVDYSTAGERLTHKAAGEKYLKLNMNALDNLQLARLLYKRLASLGKALPTINVAGNGIYTLDKHGITQAYINQCVYDILAKVNEHWPIGKIVSGGQTGVDLAGGVAGKALGIETVMTLPKGFIMRHEDKLDVEHTAEQIVGMVDKWVNLLEMESK